MTYTVRKKVFSKDSVINRMEIHFLNGDFFTIRKNEICNISIKFYDALLRTDDRLYPIAHSGFVKLKIQSGKAKGEARSLYDPKEYASGREEYIISRCLSEPIKYIKLYNELNWSDIIYGSIETAQEGAYLFLKFKPNDSFGSYDSEEHYVNLAPPSINQIFKMCLDFENCDGIDVYGDEILEMNLVFREKLEWDSSGYVRSVKCGYIIIKFDEDFDCRSHSIYNNGKKVKLKHLKRRICGSGRSVIDICNLYIDFNGCDLNGEKISVESLNYNFSEEKDHDDYDVFDSYYDDVDDDEDDEDSYGFDSFESGYAIALDDGSIKIIFGKRLH